MCFRGKENELEVHLPSLILELKKALEQQYQVPNDRRVSIIFKFHMGDHHAMGILLRHRMGTKQSQCGGFFVNLCVVFFLFELLLLLLFAMNAIFGVMWTRRLSAGNAHDRCLWSRANLQVAARMAFFGRVEFYLMSHVEVNVRIREAVKKFMAERMARGLIINKTTKKHFKELARLIFGNVQGSPLFAMFVGQERVSLRPFLKETLVVPPVMHCQV
jgi:hypothetical protein